jgi:small subunit ribosomal protein S14|tara:strand:+ start:6362 stop:6667 length:306 start_codon:yes stop_codon:yes gene_type:complete
MAKTNMIEREKKRAKLVAKFAAKRQKLREIIADPNASYEDKQVAVVQMQKQPRDASYTRQVRRCKLTGRTRGVYRKFGLGRHKLREAAMRGEVPGLKKASW